jgi:predicted Fe-Mo cluster-binding NifX family protein
MRLAIPIWNDRVSPVFDTARRLIVCEVEQKTEVGRQQVEMGLEAFPAHRVNRLTELHVNVLICGAISRALASGISTTGIALIPWVAGPVEEVLQAYLAGYLSEPRWHMPGCGGHHRQGATRGGPRCRQRG